MVEDSKKLFGEYSFRVDAWQEVAVLSILIVQLCWIVPWYQWLIDPRFVAPSQVVFVYLSFVLLATYTLSRVITLLGFNVSILRGSLFTILVAQILFGLKTLGLPNATNEFQRVLTQRVESVLDIRYMVPDEMVIILVIILMWRSGYMLARHGVRQEGVLGKFRFGLMMLILHACVTAMKDETLPIIYIIIFFFAGLMGLATARVGMISRFRGGARIAFNFDWLGGMLIGTASAVGSALIVGYWLGGELGQSLLNLVMGVIYGLGLLVISPLLFFLRPLVGWLSEMVVAEEMETTLVPTPDPGVNMFPSVEGFSSEQAENFAVGFQQIQTILIWLVITIFIFLLIRGMNSNRKSQWNDVDWQASENDGLLNSLRGVFSNPGQMINQIWRSFTGRYADSLIGAAKIRRVYARFLCMCVELGIPRPKSQTPLEFVPAASNVLVDHRENIELITNAYLRVRYGGLPESDVEVQMVVDTWNKLHDAGVEILKRKKQQQKKRE